MSALPLDDLSRLMLGLASKRFFSLLYRNNILILNHQRGMVCDGPYCLGAELGYWEVVSFLEDFWRHSGPFPSRFYADVLKSGDLQAYKKYVDDSTVLVHFDVKDELRQCSRELLDFASSSTRKSLYWPCLCPLLLWWARSESNSAVIRDILPSYFPQLIQSEVSTIYLAIGQYKKADLRKMTSDDVIRGINFMHRSLLDTERFVAFFADAQAKIEILDIEMVLRVLQYAPVEALSGLKTRPYFDPLANRYQTTVFLSELICTAASYNLTDKLEKLIELFSNEEGSFHEYEFFRCALLSHRAYPLLSPWHVNDVECIEAIRASVAAHANAVKFLAREMKFSSMAEALFAEVFNFAGMSLDQVVYPECPIAALLLSWTNADLLNHFFEKGVKFENRFLGGNAKLLRFNPLAVEVATFLLRHHLVSDFDTMLDICFLHADIDLYELCAMEFGPLLIQQRTVADFLWSLLHERFDGDRIRTPSPLFPPAKSVSHFQILFDNDDDVGFSRKTVKRPYFIAEDNYPVVPDGQTLPKRNLDFIRAMLSKGLEFDEECDDFIELCHGDFRRDLERLRDSTAPVNGGEGANQIPGVMVHWKK